MGSYSQLNINGRNVESSKSYINGTEALLFNELDKEISEESVDGETYELIRYKTSATKAYERLYVMGFSAEKSLERIKRVIFPVDSDAEDEDSYAELSEDEERMRGMIRPLSDSELATLIAQNYVFMKPSWTYDESTDERISAMQRLLDQEYEWGDELSSFDVLAVILFTLPADTEVVLDISELVRSGYYEKGEPVVEASARQENEKILVLTEGSIDARIISLSMRIHKPHLYDCFAFMDYDLKPRGGATALSEMLKAFAASGTSAKILGIFDNDTAGRDAAHMLAGLHLPKSVKYMHLPDVDFARSYPTVGPQGGDIRMDVNGCAVSIELFACKDLLVSGNDLSPVVWGGYSTQMQKYQGEISNKATISEAQIARQQRVLNGDERAGIHDWGQMPELIKSIIAECHTLQHRDL